jgi:hypothetical protein
LAGPSLDQPHGFGQLVVSQPYSFRFSATIILDRTSCKMVVSGDHLQALNRDSQ